MERSGSLCGRVAAPREPLREDNVAPSGSNQPGSQRRRPGNAKGQHRTAADAKGLQAAGSKEQQATQGSRRRIK